MLLRYCNCSRAGSQFRYADYATTRWVLLFQSGEGVVSRKISIRYRTALSLLLACSLALQVFADGTKFERDVLPILKTNCVICHGEGTPAAGLDLRTAAAVTKGSMNGPVVVKGLSQDSPLFQKVSNRQMPPPGSAQPLTDTQIQTIARWIDEGVLSAEGGPAENVETPQQVAVPLVTQEDRRFWAFQPPVRTGVPKVKQAARVRTPIDAFVLEKLGKKGLTLSQEAPKVILLRRAYFDLLGLPPSTQEIEAFVGDKRPDAYERLIDRLLASPHYGERWGRHWLDVAGYSDEYGNGNTPENFRFSHGYWRYRDYVVRSWNADKPYDRFLTEQIAGDELVDWRRAREFTPDIVDSLVATGFLRGVVDLTFDKANNIPRQRFDVLARVMDKFSSATLGLTMVCSQCHDHKYDPIKQSDYYRLAAVFAGAYDLENWIEADSRFLPEVSQAELAEIARHNEEIDRPVKELTERLAALRRPYEDRLYDTKIAAAVVPERLKEDVLLTFRTPENKRDTIQKFLFKKFEYDVLVRAEEVDASLSEAEKVLDASLKQRLEALKGWRRSPGKLFALWDVGTPSPVRLLYRGNVDTPGPLVEPGFISVLTPPAESTTATRPADTQGATNGLRLALARWLTRPDHPLTARVIVNRIWMHHFGKGIVETSGNFGRSGAKPTHPELLDWLALDFVANGWKIKRLHKLIMTSSVYRQTSQRTLQGEASIGETVDPANRLLWRMNLRRLDAESIRDSMLAVSGKLDQTLGGPPVWLNWQSDGLATASGDGPTKENPWRRSLYLLMRRNYSLSFLDKFDFPIMSLNCAERGNSATPLQSLTLMNDEFVMDRARDFAARIRSLATEQDGLVRQVETAYLLARARRPSKAEIEAVTKYLKEQQQLYLNLKSMPEVAFQASLAGLGQMLMASNEFLYID